MEAEMNNATELIDRYISIWNEPDASRRGELIAQTWTEDASYLDPVMNGEGRSGIDALARGVQEKFPGHCFRRTSDVDAHHDRIRFLWELAPEGGPVVVSGTDFGVIADGRLQTITGFFGTAPTSQSGD